MPTNHLAFANFICHFGDHGLLSFAKEIVIPAFTDTTLERTYGDDTRYFIYDARLVLLSSRRDRRIGVAGRFVKDTMLRRTQLYDRRVGLVEDVDEMASSPSAFFVLELNTHKLLFLPETPYSPDIAAFSATVRSFLVRKWKEFIDLEYDRWRTVGEGRTKQELRAEIPKPSLVVLPLNSRQSIDDFIQSLALLRKVELRLVRPNQEIDGRRIWKGLREMQAEIGSKRTVVSHTSEEGLNADEAVEQVHDASASGNQVVTLVGKDQEGNSVRGNNDSFRLNVLVGHIPQEIVERARHLYAVFRDLVQEGTLQLDSPVEEPEQIQSLLRLL